jgi:trehalose/maltose hydrolase-like predicted phosphorylase
MTSDESIFLEGGAEVIFECARFYLSLLYYKPEKDRYELLDVTGPDEYHERVNNNAFTNAMVGHTFDVCCSLHDRLNRTHPAELRALIDRLHFDRDLAAIRETREKLSYPSAATDSLLIAQFDGYFNLEDVAPEALLERKLHPNEYLGGGGGLATQTQVIKQADVVLASYLLGFPRNVKEANWRYYEPRTEHGSSLSACAYSIVGAEIGETVRAYDYFMETATIDLCGSSRRYVGPLYIAGTHSAANASAWRIVVSGFCGIRFSPTEIRIDPRLPPAWEEVEVPLIYRGYDLVVVVRRESVEIRAPLALPEEVHIEVEGSRWRASGYGVGPEGKQD